MKERIEKVSTLIKGVESISRVIFPYKVIEGEEYLKQTENLLRNNKGLSLLQIISVKEMQSRAFRYLKNTLPPTLKEL